MKYYLIVEMSGNDQFLDPLDGIIIKKTFKKSLSHY